MNMQLTKIILLIERCEDCAFCSTTADWYAPELKCHLCDDCVPNPYVPANYAATQG